MKYQPKIVVAFFKSQGLPEPELEYQFHPDRKWRFDFAWPNATQSLPLLRGESLLVKTPVSLEVDGGIWIQGGHNRGAQIKKTWEKENMAQIMGWRILKCEPKELCLVSTTDMIKQALGL